MHCKPPTGEALEAHMKVFALNGFPGAIGSTDAVNIRWWRCPAGWRAAFTGKEGYTAIGYNVTATHDRYIIHVPPGLPGSHNDKTKVRYDSFIDSVRNSDLYTNLEFEVYVDEDGTTETVKGAYVIMDGSYQH